MQVTVADLLVHFCTYQHGTLAELFEFGLSRLSSSSFTEAQILLVMICVLRDTTKERQDIHQVLKTYLEVELTKILEPLEGNARILRSLKLYIVHKYNLYISKLNPQFISVSATIAMQIIQSEQLRSD